MNTLTVNIDPSKKRSRLWKVINLYKKGWVYLKFISGAESSGNYFKLFYFFFTKSGIEFITKFFTKGLKLL
ncbi:MAG TPA: hypothetical protein VNW06_04975, partial [Cytophagaceae bacterium]|nr:hypothetical protein [Cytophagaceae bacterium]